MHGLALKKTPGVSGQPRHRLFTDRDQTGTFVRQKQYQ